MSSRTSEPRLLLIACSNRKVPTKGLLPAIQRYDGVNYRVIHKLQREGLFPSNVDVKILSARFGMIDASTPIPYYEQRMDRGRALELRSSIHKELQKTLGSVHYSVIYIELGNGYLPAVAGLAELQSNRVIWATGRIGERLAKLKNWLTKELQSE